MGKHQDLSSAVDPLNTGKDNHQDELPERKDPKKEGTMSEYFGFKIDTGQHPNANPQAQVGPPPESKEVKLLHLMQALEMGDLEHARQCFVALINAAAPLARHPLMNQLSSALQSSNLPWAQKLGRDMKKLGPKLLTQTFMLENPRTGLKLAHHPKPNGLYCLEHVDLRA